MKIKVKGYLIFRDVTGGKSGLEIEAESATLREMLVELSERLGEPLSNFLFNSVTKDINPLNIILINGRHYRYLSNGLDTALRDEDVLSIFPPMMGG